MNEKYKGETDMYFLNCRKKGDVSRNKVKMIGKEGPKYKVLKNIIRKVQLNLMKHKQMNFRNFRWKQNLARSKEDLFF